MGPYKAIWGHTGPYGAKWNHTGPYGNLRAYRGLIGSYLGSIQNHRKHIRSYRAMQGHNMGNTGPYGAMQAHMGPYWQYQVIQDHILISMGDPFSILNWFDQQKAGYIEHPPWPQKIAHCELWTGRDTVIYFLCFYKYMGWIFKKNNYSFFYYEDLRILQMKLSLFIVLFCYLK